MTRWHLILRGRVQGIGLRFRARMIAQQCKLTGWVRNMDDGNVEMELQGEQYNIDSCLEQIRNLPGIRIEKIRAETRKPDPSETRFRVH